jgi:hypothetical protein
VKQKHLIEGNSYFFFLSLVNAIGLSLLFVMNPGKQKLDRKLYGFFDHPSCRSMSNGMIKSFGETKGKKKFNSLSGGNGSFGLKIRQRVH